MKLPPHLLCACHSSFGSQRFDAFSLLCLPPELAATAAAEPAEVDPWRGAPASVNLQLVPSSATSVTLRAMRASAVSTC